MNVTKMNGLIMNSLSEIVGRKSNTVVCETLAVFSMPQIRKTGQCLEIHVDKTFREFLAEI